MPTQPRTLLPTPPEFIVQGDQLAAGCYAAALARPELGLRGWQRLARQKDWTYVSVVTERWFVGLAVVQLGYVANAFVYLVDRTQPGRWWQREVLSPLGRNVQVAASSLGGTTAWRDGDQQVAVNFASKGFRLALDVQLPPAPGTSGLSQQRLAADMQVQLATPLALITPLPSHGRTPHQGVAYTHKEAALVAQGVLTVGGASGTVTGLATLDWTRAHALRTTTWKWASLATQTPAGRIGLNLSAEVYDDAAGASLENAVWCNGTPHLLPGARFELPDQPQTQPWRIVSFDDGASFDLRFVPIGARAQDVRAGLVRSSFVQPFGIYNGYVTVPGVGKVALDGAFGVTEDHLSVW